MCLSEKRLHEKLQEKTAVNFFEGLHSIQRCSKYINSNNETSILRVTIFESRAKYISLHFYMVPIRTPIELVKREIYTLKENLGTQSEKRKILY